jgi:hypothetical protein
VEECVLARYSKHLRESTGELLGAGLLSIRGMMPGDVVDRQLEAEGAANLLAI